MEKFNSIKIKLRVWIETWKKSMIRVNKTIKNFINILIKLLQRPNPSVITNKFSWSNKMQSRNFKVVLKKTIKLKWNVISKSIASKQKIVQYKTFSLKNVRRYNHSTTFWNKKINKFLIWTLNWALNKQSIIKFHKNTINSKLFNLIWRN